MKAVTRRDFLRGGTAGAALAVFPAVGVPLARGAEEPLRFGLIGAGNRGRYLHQTFQNLGARCEAVCDVYEPNLVAAKQASPPEARAYMDYRQMLEREKLDFVVNGTPDHQHCPVLLAALDAGLDAYTEKPLSLSLEQSQKMVEAVKESGRIVQVGMQRRSMGHIYQMKQHIEDGVIGEISMAKAKWNWNFAVPLDNSPLPGKLNWDLFLGDAPKREFEPKRFRWWRGFYDYSGGNMTDQGTHLMDVVQWMTGNGTPQSAVAQGYIAEAKGGEVPDVFSVVFEYPRMLATWTLNYTSSYENDWSILFQGREGTILLDASGYRIFSEPGRSRTPWAVGGDVKVVAEQRDTGGAEAHMQNLLDCIRTRQQPNCTVEIAAAAVAGPHMANLSLKEDRKVRLG
jgi:predicted dehydrogenase